MHRGGVKLHQARSTNSCFDKSAVCPPLTLQRVEAIAHWSGPAQANTVRLGQPNGEQQRLPEDGTASLNLLELVDGWAGDVAIKVHKGRDVLQA